MLFDGKFAFFYFFVKFQCYSMGSLCFVIFSCYSMGIQELRSLGGLAYGRTAYGQMLDGWTDGPMDRRINEQTDKWTDGQTDR